MLIFIVEVLFLKQISLKEIFVIVNNFKNLKAIQIIHLAVPAQNPLN